MIDINAGPLWIWNMAKHEMFNIHIFRIGSLSQMETWALLNLFYHRFIFKFLQITFVKYANIFQPPGDMYGMVLCAMTNGAAISIGKLAYWCKINPHYISL